MTGLEEILKWFFVLELFVHTYALELETNTTPVGPYFACVPNQLECQTPGGGFSVSTSNFYTSQHVFVFVLYVDLGPNEK